MASNRKGLGRGLSALIPDAEMDTLSDVMREEKPPVGRVQPAESSREVKRIKTNKEPDAATSRQVQENIGRECTGATAIPSQGSAMISTDSIVPNPFQPRRSFGEEELEELAASIRLHGVLQPILVRPAPSGEVGAYQLVAGERRWRAAQKAGLKQVPVVMRAMADQQALELALIENVQRHDISAMDAATAYHRLASEFALSQEQISRRVGKSRSAVANTIRLLDLPEEARKAIEKGTMSEGHGRAILLAASEGTRRALLRRVLRDKLSVRETENMARHLSQIEEDVRQDQSAKKESSTSPSQGEWSKAEQICTKRLGTRVKIKATTRRSTILIECGNADELQRVLALLQEKL